PRPFAEPPDVPALSPYAYPKAFSLVLALLRLALGLLRLAGGDQRETGRRHRARLVVDGQLALRPVEVNPHRVSQNRPAIGLAQHPGAQHAARVSVAPPESFRDRGRGVRQRTDLVSLGRKRLRPPGAKKLDLLARLRRAAFPVGFAHDLGRASAGTIRLKLKARPSFCKGSFRLKRPFSASLAEDPQTADSRGESSDSRSTSRS